MHTKRTLPLALVVLLGLSGCAGMSSTEQRTVSGGAIGAAAGAAGAAVTGGCVACGAALGGAAGAATGYIVDKTDKDRD